MRSNAIRGAASAELYDSVGEIAHLSDVIRSKQAANLPTDRLVIPALRYLLAEK